MKKLLLLLSVVICFASGCSTPSSISEYFSDRGRNFSEILVAGAGYGYGLHAKANVFIPLGLGYGYSRTKEYGWDGRAGFREFSWYRQSVALCLLPVGFSERDAVSSEDITYKEIKDDKVPEGVNYLYYSDTVCYNSSTPVEKSSSGKSPVVGLLGADCTAGFLSFRFNLSSFALVNSFLGIFCLDIDRDDTSNIKESDNHESKD